MLNGSEIIEVKGRKFLFCGFSKSKIKSRENNSDLAYATEIIVLSRVLPQLKNYGYLSMLGAGHASFLSLNENGELDGASKFVSKNKVGVDIFSDVNIIGYMDDMENKIMLWNAKLSLITGTKRTDRTFYTTDEALRLLQNHLEVYQERDKEVLTNFLIDFVSLYKETPYYDMVRENYLKDLTMDRKSGSKYDFQFVRKYAIYEKDGYFYFFVNQTKCFLCDIIPMNDFDAVLNKFALRSVTFNHSKSMKLKFGRID